VHSHHEHHGLSLAGAALAVISTIVGGGIVGLPFAFYNSGLPAGLVILLLMCLQTVASTRIYLACKDLLPGQPETLFEIGYVLFKRSSIFMISMVLIFNSFGLIMVYFIVFGDTLSSLVRNLSNGSITEQDFLGKRVAYVIILGSLLTPVVIKRELNEISILSVLLFVSIFAFIILTAIQLAQDGVSEYNTDFTSQSIEVDLFYSDYMLPKFDMQLINSLSIFLVSFSFQQNLFPIYSELKEKTTEQCVKAISIGTYLVTTLYISISALAIYMYGSRLESSVL
jgi:amino acid permease